jgi:hypothetical protein
LPVVPICRNPTGKRLALRFAQSDIAKRLDEKLKAVSPKGLESDRIGARPDLKPPGFQ